MSIDLFKDYLLIIDKKYKACIVCAFYKDSEMCKKSKENKSCYGNKVWVKKIKDNKSKYTPNNTLMDFLE
jgi:hypothetical protein